MLIPLALTCLAALACSGSSLSRPPGQPKMNESAPERLYPIFKKSKIGFIDNRGRVAIEPQFDSADDFSKGLAAVKVNHRYGFIDKTGRMVIEPQWQDAGSFLEGLARVGMVGMEDKSGFIDKTGQVVIKPQFDDAYEFHDGIAHVTVNGAVGYIDKAGKYVWQPSR